MTEKDYDKLDERGQDEAVAKLAGLRPCTCAFDGSNLCGQWIPKGRRLREWKKAIELPNFTGDVDAMRDAVMTLGGIKRDRYVKWIQALTPAVRDRAFFTMNPEPATMAKAFVLAATETK